MYSCSVVGVKIMKRLLKITSILLSGLTFSSKLLPSLATGVQKMTEMLSNQLA
jgi:hypothetical protein